MLQNDVAGYPDYLKLRPMIEGKTFMITGITGLIGSILARYIINLTNNVVIFAPVRNIPKAQSLLDDIKNYIVLLSWPDYKNYTKSCDYIIHCAAPTASTFFVQNPVDTFKSIVNLTEEILDNTIESTKIKSIVYLSSLEVYGETTTNNVIDEGYQGYVNPIAVRSSYPMSKRMAENICCLYSAQYNLPIKIARLTQVSGIGVASNDNRIFTQFCRLKSHHQPIILNTTGHSSRTYCYTLDAIYGILTILLRGKNGECYNVSNDETYISACDLAYKIASIPPEVDVQTIIDNSKGYANDTHHKISSDKLRELGWSARVGLEEMIQKVISYVK